MSGMSRRKRQHHQARQQQGTASNQKGFPSTAQKTRGRPGRLAGLAIIVCLAAGSVFVYAKYHRSREDRVTNRLPAASQPVVSTNQSLSTNQGLVQQRVNEGTSASLNEQANARLKARDFSGAIEAYKRAIALTPGDEDLHFNLGIAYVQNGDLTNAEREYKQALELLPDYPEVHNNLGNLLLRSGRMAEAEEHFTEALKQMPEYAQAHNNLGTLRQRQQRTEDALRCFQKAVESDTNYWEAHYNLANTYLQLKQPDKAAAEYREALRINPAFETARRALEKISAPGEEQKK
jgi:tetratricopeptide (TPR) repeat protein